MDLVLSLVLAYNIGLCLSQIHLGPIDASLTCYHCNAMNPFPECLAQTKLCAPGQVCSVSYSASRDYEINCLDGQRCLDETAHYDRLCTGGGVAVQNKCRLCCETNECVSNITNLMHLVVDPGMFCPGQCSVKDTASCLPNGERCFTEEFCRIEVIENFQISGTCRRDLDWQKCYEDKERQPCWIPPYPVDHVTRCVVDCCNTSDCLASYFGSHLGSFPLTVTTTAITTTETHEKAFSCFQSHPHSQPTLAPFTECPEHFCMLTIEDTISGSRLVTKNCTTEALCKDLWLNKSMTNEKCWDYIKNPTKLSNEDLTCNFCCHEEMCNNDVTLEKLYWGH